MLLVFLNLFIDFVFSLSLFLLSAMTKKILDWKPDLTKELDEDGWSISPSLCCICGL